MDAFYARLIEERPCLFLNTSDHAAIRIITDRSAIADFEEAHNTKIGVLYQDSYVLFIKDLVEHPNGKIGTYIRIVPAAKESGVVLLPIDADKFILIKHFRHSTRRAHFEFPRGFGDDDLSVKENAAKELFEETGYTIRSLEFIGNVYPDTGLLSMQASVYAAYVDPQVKQAADGEEAICSIETVAPDRLRKMIQDGDITDGYTLSALALYWARGGKL